MPQLTITLTDDEFLKLKTEAKFLRRDPAAQAEVLVLEWLKLPLKPVAKPARKPADEPSMNGPVRSPGAVPA